LKRAGLAGEIMNTVFERYSNLIESFLNRELSSQAFSDSFITLFKNETGPMEESIFLLLDELFGDADAFTSDAVLLAEDPAFYLNERDLESKVHNILHRMKIWRSQQVAA
jgi:hypothetical protein